MKRLRYSILPVLLLLNVAMSFAAESISLTTPVPVDPRTATTLKVEKVILDVKGKGFIVTLGNEEGASFEIVENGDTAVTLMRQLNKANLSTKSLERRILEWAQGKIASYAGPITGTPD